MYYYFIVAISGLMGPFTFTPGVLNIANYMGLYNMTEKVLNYPAQYYVDVDKYYPHMIFHGIFATSGFVMMVIACDSMLIFFIQHECAVCEILR